MTNDQQQVEAWRSQFEAWYDKHTNFNWGVAYYLNPDEKYCFADVELAWQSFLGAKRSQPTIELPAPATDHYHYDQVDIGDVKEAITAAGYSYMDKGQA